MNKKLFILLFIFLAVCPVFADDNPYRDELLIEEPPSISDIETIQPVKQKHSSFSEKIKHVFSKSKKDSTVKAKEIDVEEPEIDDDVQGANEIPAVNDSQENTVLTDTAYQGSINTNKIIEVDDCVKIALEHHPQIQSALGTAEIYKSRIAQAWSNYFPTFSAGLSYSRNNAQIVNVNIPVQKYDLFYVPNISGNLLLFDFGKTKAEADIAKKSYESAQYSLESTISNVIFNVKQAYYNLLFAQQQVQVYEDTVRDFTLHMEQAKAYYAIGTKPKIDVLTAEYNLGKAKLNLIQAKNTLKIAFVQLSNAMGMPEYSDYSVIDNLATRLYDIDSKTAIDNAFYTNTDLLAAKKKADASELLVRAARRAFTPDINGFASYTNGGKRIDTDHGYQIGAGISYSNVNLLYLKKQTDEAKATYKKDLADYENIKQNVYFDVQQAYINLTNAQDRIVVAKLSMDQAKEQYDQASGRYKVGLGDAIELKDAETTYRNAQLDFYNNLLSYHVSAANLERLMGVPLKLSDTDLL